MSAVPRAVSELYARLPASAKFKRDSAWNMASMAFCGLAGLALILIISKNYDPEYLGLFSLTESLYIILAQVAAFGVPFSVLKHAAQSASDKVESGAILASAFLVVFAVSLAVAGLTLLARAPLAGLFNKPKLAASILYVSPALLFFALNKLFFSFLNALRFMKSYAVFQALRFVFILASLGALVLLTDDGTILPLVFSVSEALLAVVMAASLVVIRRVRLGARSIRLDWVGRHFVYGAKSLFGTICVQATVKLDILILGLFAASRTVGIYSFAAILVEAFNQVPVVLRTNVNPLLTVYRYGANEQALGILVKKGRTWAYKLLVPAGILAVAVYPVLISAFSLNPDYKKGWVPFILLMSGAMISSGYRPFLMILNQTGFPGHQSYLFFLMLLTLFAGNIVLVPIFGMTGAAVGTALASVAAVFFLRRLVWKTNGIRF